MGKVQTGIELNDQFTSVIYDIINSVNLAVVQMDEMAQAMNADINTSSLEGARDEINQATIAMDELNAALQETQANVSAPTVDTGTQAVINVDVNPNLPDPLVENPDVIPVEIQPNAPPDPVEIPVQWETDGLDVFTSTGIERFQQEVQSTNTMLGRLNETQSQIEQTASTMNILPQSAVQDISNLGTRIQQIQGRMNAIAGNPINMGTETANSELERLRSQLNQAVQEQGNLNQAIQNMDIDSANAAYERLTQTIGSTERYIRDNVDEQGQFNDSIQNTHSLAQSAAEGFKGWQKAIIIANQALGVIQNTLGKLGVFNMDGAFDRIDTMNQFQRTVSTMTGDTNAARAALSQLKDTTVGTAYGLDVASKATQGFLTRGMSLGAATDQVRVWADAVSFYGKGTNDQLETVVDAIGKMYSKGTVEASQLDRLFDAGIGAAEIYADAVNRSVSEVKEDLSAGTISATEFISTVSQAMDSGVSAGAAKEAGATWATTFANVQSAITRGWTNVINSLDAALADRGLPSSMEMIAAFGAKAEEVLNGVANAMGTVVDFATRVYDVASNVYSFFSDNWSTIAPIIGGVAAAFVAFKIATLAAAAAQWIMNLSMAACPITWIAIGIGLLVAALIATIVHIIKVGDKIAELTGIASSGFGVICGGINVVIQFFKNLFMQAMNIAFGINCAMNALGSNIQASFHNSICKVQVLWWGLLSTVLTVVAGICEALNNLPFITFDYSGITSKANEYAGKAAEAAGNVEEYKDIGEAFNKGASTLDTFQDGWVADAFNAGAAWGDGIADKVSNFNLTDLFGTNDNPGAGEYTSLLDDSLNNSGVADNLDTTASNTGAIKDSLSTTEEELKYLRDLAEQETVNKFTIAEVNIEQNNNNSISSGMDLDGLVSGLTDAVDEAAAVIAEGVHT